MSEEKIGSAKRFWSSCPSALSDGSGLPTTQRFRPWPEVVTSGDSTPFDPAVQQCQRAWRALTQRSSRIYGRRIAQKCGRTRGDLVVMGAESFVVHVHLGERNVGLR